MADTASLISVLIILIVIGVFAPIIINTVEGEHLGNFYYLSRTAEANLSLNESGSVNLSLQRINTRYNANLTIIYEGGG